MEQRRQRFIKKLEGRNGLIKELELVIEELTAQVKRDQGLLALAQERGGGRNNTSLLSNSLADTTHQLQAEGFGTESNCSPVHSPDRRHNKRQRLILQEQQESDLAP